MRVLIADDHPVVRKGLREIVASEHDMIVVGEAKSGDEALDLAKKLDWDVAVFDYAMPGCSGADLVREVKRQHPGRPVLVLSILPEEVHAGQVFKAGGAGYINKGSANEDLTGAIRKVVGGGKYVSPAFAEKLATELAEGGEKPPHNLLSDREYRVMWLIASGLERAGYQAIRAASVEQAEAAIREVLPDLMLLDWILPGTTGMSFLRHLRSERRTREIPVIMLTGRSDEIDKVAGLEAGADDYLTKPFSHRELLARIKAVVRRRAPLLGDEPVEFGDLKLDPAAHRITAASGKISLWATEFRLLHFLMTHPDRVYSRGQLLD